MKALAWLPIYALAGLLLVLPLAGCGDDETACDETETACDDGVDNDCDGDTDLDDTDCDPGCDDGDGDGYDDATCGGDDCDDGDADIHPGVAEVCDDVDQDCDAATDEGCDDDDDGWCDDALAYDDGGAGSLPVCAQGPGDCNDDALSGAGFNPGAGEICDGMDNNCDGTADEGCAALPPVADAGPDRFPPERDDPINWVVLDANGSFDPDGELPLSFAWSCTAGTIADPGQALTRLNDIDCAHPTGDPITCTVTVTDQGGLSDQDQMQVILTNNPPLAMVAGVPGLPGQMVVRAAADSDPATVLTLDAGPSQDPDDCHDAGLSFAWTGPDAGLLDDAASETPSLDNTAGSYDLTLTVTDAEGASDQIDVLVVISDCVWVGPACPAAVPSCRLIDTSSGGMSDRVSEGLDAAENEGYGLVCLAAGDYSETELIMRAGIGLRGGYDGAFVFDGNPNRAAVTVADARGAYFGPGASQASLEYLTIAADVAAADAEQRAAVTVEDTPAAIAACRIEGNNPAGAAVAAAYGVRVTGDGGAPVVIAGNPDIRGATGTTPAFTYGVHIGGGAEVILAGSRTGLTGPRQSVRGGAALHESYAVYVDGTSGARLEARDNWLLHGCGHGASAGVMGAGVYLHGGGDHRIENTEDIQGCEAPLSFGVLTMATDASTVAGNGLIIGRGSEVSAAVADGWVGIDGSLTPGGSTGLFIADNQSLWGSDVHGWGDTSLILASGIQLVGSTAAEVLDNGQRIGTGYGDIVIGGRVDHQPAAGGLNPVAPGLWTVQTNDVLVARNYLQSGLFADSPPDELPAVAFQDGVPGQPATASAGLVLDANAIIADVPALDAAPVQLSRAMAVRLLGTQDALLTNNLIATMSGNHLYGIWLEGASASLINNTIDVDLKLWNDFPCPVYLARFGIYGVDAAGGSDWVNNAIRIRQLDDPICGGVKPNDDQAALWFVAAGGAGLVPVDRMRNNVLFMEGDDLGSSDAPDYAVVASDHYDGAPSLLGAWPAAAVNALAGVSDIGDNAVADPILIDGSTGGWERVKNELHLGAASPCIDAGLTPAAPDHDYFGRARPAGAAADIGCEEAP